MAMWTLVALLAAAVPGVAAWWTGRGLLARRDDPALPERILARSYRLVQVTAAAVGVILVVGPYTPWTLLLPLLGLYVGGYPAHKVLHEERRGLASYLLSAARWWLATLGIWTLLAFAPAIIASAGEARWPVAAGLAVGLVLWHVAYTRVLRRVLDARALAREDLASRFAAILSRARAAEPDVLRFGFPGARVVNAFALPSPRRGTVLFGDQLLELFEPDEVAAIFAHEVAHLEHVDRKRLALARVSMWAIIGLTVVVAPLLDQWMLATGRLLDSVWVVAVGFGLLLMGAARQKHEADSDLRAVELCGDPEALVRALVKLHALAHLPRRWAADFERNASHPSLARRVQAIRAAAHAMPARFDQPLVVSTATIGTFVVLDSERVEWLEGVGIGADAGVTALREHAQRSRGWRYSELVELRVRPGSGDKVSLAATERSGSAWSVPLRSEDVGRVQQALDVVDVRLAQRAARASWPALLVRAVAAVGMMAALVASSALSVFVAGLIALIRPHTAPLSALAVASIGAALLAASRSEWSAEATDHIAIMLALLGAVALAALLLLRRAQEHAGDQYRRVPALTSAALAVVAVASLLPLWYRSDPRPLDHWGFLAAVPSVFVAASGAGAALLARDHRWGRRAGIALMIVGIAPLGLGAAWPNVGSPIHWQHVAPTLLHQTELDRPGIELRASPSGGPLAVRVARRAPGEAPWAFRVLGGANDTLEVAADDLAFLDDDRLLVVRREDSRLQLALITAGSAAPTWRVTLPPMVGAHLTVSPATGAWTVIGSEPAPESESALVAVAGVVGRPDTHVKRWVLASESDAGSTWAVTGLETAFEVRTRLRGDWSSRWPMLAALFGHALFDSEIWRRGPDGDRKVASAGAVIRCTAAAEQTVVCLGYGAAERLVWVLRDASRESEQPAILPASTWKVGLIQNRLVGMTATNAVLILGEDRQRGVQVNIPPEMGRSLDTLVVGKRLVVLSNRPPGGAVSVYALP
jgi:heat shock protein HtpX